MEEEKVKKKIEKKTKLSLFSLCLCEVERHAPRHGNLRFETLTLALARLKDRVSVPSIEADILE